MRRRGSSMALAMFVIAACTSNEKRASAPRVVASLPDASSVAPPSAPIVAASLIDAISPVDAAVEAAPAYPGRTDGCANGMVRVDGEYCPVAVARCLATMPRSTQRCARFEEPARCMSAKTEHLAFCMDRFEYPNEEGKLPITLVDFHDANRLCAESGKRVCTVDEFNFACEGPDLHPYATGFSRDAASCNYDRDFETIMPFRMPRHDECMNDPRCVAEVARADRRYPIGQRLGCVSWAGVYDLNGNVNEWVRLPEKKQYPARGGLKGGWWAPIRARCRPTHTTHNEDYWGYEVGFRCCKDAEGVPTDTSGVHFRASASTDR